MFGLIAGPMTRLARPEHRLEIFLRSGDPIRLVTFAKRSPMVKSVLHQHAKAEGPAAVRAIREGEVQYFGAFDVGPEWIAKGETRILWSDVTSCSLDGFSVAIKTPRTELRQKVDDVHNPILLVKVVRLLREASRTT
jgi:hypothetical protein